MNLKLKKRVNKTENNCHLEVNNLVITVQFRLKLVFNFNTTNYTLLKQKTQINYYKNCPVGLNEY